MNRKESEKNIRKIQKMGKTWHEGGKTTAENCQMLCKDDNRIIERSLGNR